MNKNTLTQEWYRHLQILRCAFLIPDDGIDASLFIFSVGDDLQCAARECIRYGKFFLRDGNRIKLLSPLLTYGLQPTEPQVIDFLNGLYSTLGAAIEQYKKPNELSLEEKAEQICQKRKKLNNVDNLTDIEEKLLKKIDLFLPQLRFLRIGGLEHLKEEVTNLYNAIGMLYYTHFGNERIDAIQAFREEKGETICTIFYKALDTIQLRPHVQENMLELMIEYYKLGDPMFEEIVVAAERLLCLMEKRNAEAWELAWIYMELSDAYLGTFKTNADWLSKSDYYLKKSCEYSKIAYEESQQLVQNV